ncbi:recombinase family protein [Undibacterium sp.]|jgi:DNA invertase Pin-like site-specific DNA recombinase|uniref:recombinase family protein n=1 Tax=Undibacterium sp. TaxID=1914977 RepID=UPI002BC2C7FE|nr:recombinase family protein [Undibacterium sp.]HTD02728.1 recombinase family protein [Undibacterium sp.]
MQLESETDEVVHPDAAAILPAVEYVRMSTEHQKYSIANQSATIREYAREQGLEIIRTYVDAGKSGLTIHTRKGLQQLIQDVEAKPDFKVILVYDVSRWGRFQDADESAYYEYACRKAGVDVRYCAEPFVNDGSPLSGIIKSIKRAMAGEYSRELSVKIFAGQCRRFEAGYHQGGLAGYALRRVVIDCRGETRTVLRPGERKAVRNDRTILVPGPQREIAVVNQIFQWFVAEGGASEECIARYLNAMQVPNARGTFWRREAVHKLLTNELYLGVDTYNRQSNKLRRRLIKNPPDMWLRFQCPFQPIVSPELFWRAQEVMATRRRNRTDEAMLKKLHTLYEQYGYLSRPLIRMGPGMPAPETYYHRFGSLRHAYQLVGYQPRGDDSFVIARHYEPIPTAACIDAVFQQLPQAEWHPTTRGQLNYIKTGDGLLVSITAVPCRDNRLGGFCWTLRKAFMTEADVTIAVRLQRNNQDVRDYYVLPSAEFRRRSLCLQEHNPQHIEVYRVDSLDGVWQLFARSSIRRQ